MALLPLFVAHFWTHPVCFLGAGSIGVDLTESTCSEGNYRPCYGILILPPFFVVTVVLVIRTYAVWNKDKRVGIGLALLLIACQIPNTIFVERFIEEIHCKYSSSFSCSEPVPPDAKAPLLSHRESIPEYLQRVFGHQWYEYCLRQLGGVHYNGRRCVALPMLGGFGSLVLEPQSSLL